MAPPTKNAAQSALVAAVGEDGLRRATEVDSVAGVTPRWVAEVDGTERAAAVMRVAAEHELRVVARGSGSRLHWGNPPESVDLLLDLSAANAVVEHAAGDLVVRVQAGARLADVQRVVGEQGQQLSLENPNPTATIGGIIATGCAGPSRQLHGAVRDLLIGITVVRADGTVTVSGGKVVKNVAGYDLGKLYTGSYGTLGVITEAIFRLHPRAAAHRWVRANADDSGDAARLVDAIRGSQAMPSAIEIDTESGDITVCAELDGRPGVTEERAGVLATELGATVHDAAPRWWGRYPFDAAGTGLRLVVPPATLADLLDGVREVGDACEVTPHVRGSAGVGVLDVGVTGERVAEFVADVRAVADRLGGSAVVLSAPAGIRPALDVWGPVPNELLALMRRTKSQFDPGNLLSPGRFVGGI